MENDKIHLAIVGIRGIPNSYGGFETLTEYLVEYLAPHMEITVYCSSKDMDTSLTTYKGANLKYIPLSSHGSIGILYDSIAFAEALIKYDKVLFLGFGGGFVLPFFKKYRSKIILNLGGLDWKRNKWSGFAQAVIKTSERLLVRYSAGLVADNIGIRNYIFDTYNRNSTLIAYGGDQAVKRAPEKDSLEKYAFLQGEYAFSVTRIQEDNNIDMILDAFCSAHRIPLVMVGNWTNSAYGIRTKSKYVGRAGLFLLEAIYDREKLDVLRSNCTVYIHGHSAGGTNPSLVEAMSLGLPVFAFASGYNEFTTENKALYFRDRAELAALVQNYKNSDLGSMGMELQNIAHRLYRWEIVAGQYKKLIMADVK
ncbi:MAG: DUF1972 domain-containing protein [Daejeonella sp.]